MKYSINKIFKNLIFSLIFIAVISGLVALLVVEQNYSYTKIDNLNNQKYIISALTKLQKKDMELALIQFNGKSTQLLYEIDKLRNLYKYDYSGKFILNNSNEYLSDLDKLEKLTKTFNKSAQEYYTKNNINKTNLKNAFYNINSFIDTIIFKNITYEKQKFQLFKNLVLFLFFSTVIITFWYRKRLKAIYNDILNLYAIDNNKNGYKAFSEEADAILLKMKRKPAIIDNPALLDPVTMINNYKGMLNSYSVKKGMKGYNFTSVTIFEIDNFSKTNKVYSQEIIQNVLKKIAFILSLHEQATDVIARTDYNQFTIILSRISKKQSLKDIEIIHQSISEIKLKTTNVKSIKISISAGFIIKPNNKSLEEAVKQSKEILQYSKDNGGNRISQIQDLAEHEL